MYESNIYIKNYAEVKKYHGDMGVQLDHVRQRSPHQA